MLRNPNQRCRSKKLNKNNEDENAVLNARFFSFYKGRLAVKIAGFKDRSFSIGAMFISPKLEAGDQYAIDIVKHEYGHTLQLSRLGFFRYMRYIAIPSMKSDPDDPGYFALPWEITADIYGGVDRGQSDEEKQRGEDYINNASPKRSRLNCK